MGNYGQIAVKAAKYKSEGRDARDAWNLAADEVFDRGSSSWSKSCPRSAFLGFCGVDGKNAQYAHAGFVYLKENPDSSVTDSQLWAIVKVENPDLQFPSAYNHQMDVVLSLFRADLLDNQGQLK